MPYTSTYDPAEADLEDRVREADQASRAALRAPITPGGGAAYLNRTRETAAALGRAADDLEDYRRQRDPAAYEAHEQWQDDNAGHDYALSQEAHYYIET